MLRIKRPGSGALRPGAGAPALLLLLAGLLGPALPAAGQDALTYRIEGVGGSLRENLRAHLGPSPADRASVERFLVMAPERAQRALEALGYYDGETELRVDRTRSPWRATFIVDPGEALRYTAASVNLEGEGAEDPQLLRLVQERAPRPGDVLHHGRYEDFRRDLQQLARQRGFFDATLDTHRIDVNVAAQTAELQLRFVTGTRYRFGPLRAEDALLDDQFLERLESLREGEFYTQDRLLSLRQRLLRLGYFSSVVVVPELPDRGEGTVPIRIDVQRAPRHSYEMGLGFSTDTRERVSLLWNTPRINSRGHSQQTSLRWSPINPEFRITYTIPMNDLANDVVQVITRLENNEYGDLDSQQRELALRRERVARRGVYSTRVRALNEGWEALREDFTADFLLAGVSYSTRRRGGVAVDPDAGFSQFYEVEVAGEPLGSDEDLLRAYAQFVGVRRFAGTWRVVLRSELGALFSGSSRPDEIPPSLSFFAGGDNSIRGYAYQSVGRDLVEARLLDTPLVDASDDVPEGRRLTVGGTRLVTGSVELQRYLSDTWRMAVFADGGDAFTGENFDPEVGVGLGVHYLSPVGALRFEIASPVTQDPGDWRIHINIGAEF